jgi:hypothetical protein
VNDNTQQMRYLEDRIKLLEATVVTLRENSASMKTLVDVIHTDMREIKNAVVGLTAAMNRGKGGVAMLITISTTVGGFLTWLVVQVFGKAGQ